MVITTLQLHSMKQNSDSAHAQRFLMIKPCNNYPGWKRGSTYFVCQPPALPPPPKKRKIIIDSTTRICRNYMSEGCGLDFFRTFYTPKLSTKLTLKGTEKILFTPELTILLYLQICKLHGSLYQ